ncbi:carbohydrate ABC transporter permease [Nonomuraea sp. NBC_01738]|uniref:carbohydrate ABC transporter permease n=1 Tax=Nonomuraea sp. NBC_01738 TaxID=2976003 RepID=UPI002E0FF18D|nr:carbohydrate ABC transporter permease [Nonomuraea sp. NBC_01738]
MTLPRRTLTHILLLGIGFAYVYPFLWAVGSSLKSPMDFLDTGLGLVPPTFMWENYATAWNQASFGTYFLNTVIISLLTVVGTLLLTAMAGFALARHTFPGKKTLIGIIGATFLLPHGYTIIPVFDIVKALGLLDTIWSVVLVQVGGGLVFGTFMFMAYFQSMPKELEEAARVDGAGYNTLFFRVILPLSRPMAATLGLFTFISSWNNFFLPLVFTFGKPELRTLGVGLYAFTSETSTKWTLLCAGAIISLAPIVVVFVVAQRYVVDAIAGAVKA